ncbi:MAG: BamA/OMP85 family outer membrane protein, partial [Candidatus Eiseniibacteriota bacterium]
MPRRLGVARLAVAARLAIAALLLLFVPGISRAQDDLDVERTVRKVEMHGNDAYGDGTLKELLRTRGSSFWNPFKKHPLRPDFIRSDRLTLTTYYRRHGFLKAQVESVIVIPAGKSSKSDVHFYVTEGPRTVVADITTEGLGPLTDAVFKKTLRYEVGSPLDMPILEASRDSIVYAYADRGYVLARVVDSLAVADDSVRVFYRIEPGPKVALNQVLIEGTKKTKSSYVSREMLLRPGDTIRRSKLILSQQRIYDSGLYSDVEMSLGHPDSATYRSDLVVSVREQKMGWVDAGIGYGTVDQIRLTGQWGQRNIFHTGMRFVATGRLGLLVEKDLAQTTFGDRRIDLALTHPWPFGVKLQTTLGVYAEEQPIIQETDQFPLRAQGGSIVVASPFFRDIRSYL